MVVLQDEFNRLKVEIDETDDKKKLLKLAKEASGYGDDAFDSNDDDDNELEDKFVELHDKAEAKAKKPTKKPKEEANVECDEWCQVEKEVECKRNLIEEFKEEENGSMIGEKEKHHHGKKKGKWSNKKVNKQFNNIMGFYKDGNKDLDALVEETCDMDVALSMKKKISGKKNRGGRRKTRRKSRKKKRKSRKKRRKSRRKRKRKKRRTRRRR